MARLDTSRTNPVVILTDTEWVSVQALVEGGAVPRDEVGQALKRAGVIDTMGVTEKAIPVVQGRATARRHLDVVRIDPRFGARQVEAWIGPARTTMAKHLEDGLHVYGIDACEVAAVFAEFLDFRPRHNIDQGPYVLPAPQATRVLTGDGELSALPGILTRAGKAMRRSQGGGQGTTPLIEGLINQTWSLTAITTSLLTPQREWEVEATLHTLSVEECLYEIYPRSVALEAGNTEAQGGDPDDLLLTPEMSMTAWLRTTPWYYA